MKSNTNQTLSCRRPVVWRLIPLLLLCPLAGAFGSGIPDPDDHGPTNIILNSWCFTDTTNWFSDLGYPPVAFTNLKSSDLGDGAALAVDSPDPAWLQYNVVENDGTTNLTVDNGTVMFWYAPAWSGTNAGGSGPGEWSRLIEVGAYTEDASYGWWSCYVDPAGVNLYFSAQGNDGCQTNYISVPIAWTSNRWVLLALTYSTATNCALYLNGEWVADGPPMSCRPGPEVLAGGFYLGSASNGLAQAHGMFDQLSTFANPLDAGTIAATYWWWYVPFYLNPLNEANLSPAPFYTTNTPTFRAVMGPGYLEYVGTASVCVTNASVWITNATATALTNWTTSLVFTIMGGHADQWYDVFGSLGLAGNGPADAQWAWLGQVSTCSQYSLTNMPGGTALVILGTPLDSDNDGLTDAYELLVSKTDPNDPDSDGDGIPDWWSVVYLGGGAFDPYALCPSGDGWTYLQAYQNGWDPNLFYTPPPPQNVAARVDSTGTNVIITWTSGGGPVTNYVIERGYQFEYGDGAFAPVGQVGPSIFTCTSTPEYPLTGAGAICYQPVFRVCACFTNGSSAVSQSAPVTTPDLTVGAALVRGPGGRLYLAASALPASVTTLRLYLFYWPELLPGFDIAASSLTNGVVLLSSAETEPYPSYSLGLQAFTGSGSFGNVSFVGRVFDVGQSSASPPIFTFANASQHLKENLRFLLSSATLNQRFSYCSGVSPSGGDLGYCPGGTSLDGTYARPASSGAYEYYGFRVFSPTLDYSVLQELRPVGENYLWRNLAYDPMDFDSSGRWINGVAYDPHAPEPRQLFYPQYRFTGTNVDSPPLAFSLSNHSLFFMRDIAAGASCTNDLAEIGIVLDGTNIFIPSDVSNAYGLTLQSAVVISGYPYPLVSYTLEAGGPSKPVCSFAHYFCNFEAPVLETVDYYFASQTPYFNYHSDYGTPRPPLPGSPDFTVTNTSPLLITGLGQPITVTGWAKQRIANGYTNKFAYLEQYFDQAHTMDANGNVTSNSAGLLSPYGEFFPMQPGPAALLTMPDIETSQRGTGVVHVLKLQLDVNHDGNMDLSFAGPDNTLPERPFVFWVNNDCDWATRSPLGNPSDPGHDVSVLGGSVSPNYDYRDICVRSQRDLEDYARVWLCGMPDLPANQGYQVTLSLANASRTNFAVNLVNAVEADGGTGYLTDTNVAAAQVAYNDFSRDTSPGYKIALLTSSRSYTFPDDYFTNNATKHFLFEGAGIGSGQLVLTISQATPQGTNVIAQTGAWLDLRDVRNMYEQVHISGVTNSVPPNIFLSSSYQQLNWADSSSDQDTNIIVFVHGWRMGVWDYYNFSESMFKRLYWQGYRGRFASIRWDTLSKDDFKFASTLQSLTTYNSSEYRAWESAKGVSDYLTSLKQRFPNYNLNVCAHSMGNVVMAEALKLQLAAGQRNVNNYVLMQAAVPASCYDTSFTNYAPMLAAEASQPTPNTYWGHPGAINGAVSGHLVNFFNANDYALATATIYIPLYGSKAVSWEANQMDYKPDSGFDYTTDGTNSWNLGFFPTKLITDSHEIMSFCARPRSKAVGAQSGVAGVIQGGSVDLHANFGFDLGSDQHSAQFNWNIQQLSGFYRQLGISFGVLQPSTP